MRDSCGASCNVTPAWTVASQCGRVQKPIILYLDQEHKHVEEVTTNDLLLYMSNAERKCNFSIQPNFEDKLSFAECGHQDAINCN